MNSTIRRFHNLMESIELHADMLEKYDNHIVYGSQLINTLESVDSQLTDSIDKMLSGKDCPEYLRVYSCNHDQHKRDMLA